MKTFYDNRTLDIHNPIKYPLQGYVILSYKNKWLLWIDKDSHYLSGSQSIKGFIVCPKTIYLYNVYIAKNFWDALKNLFYKPKKVDLKIFTELEEKCEADQINKWVCGFSTSHEENLENKPKDKHS